VVLDVFSRRIVGWSMATTLATRLVLDALNMALSSRRKYLCRRRKRHRGIMIRSAFLLRVRTGRRT
jgi:transposase InsO family protein